MQRRPLQQTNTCLMKMKIGSKDLELTTLLDSAALYYSITFYFFFLLSPPVFSCIQKKNLMPTWGMVASMAAVPPSFFLFSSFFFLFLSLLPFSFSRLAFSSPPFRRFLLWVAQRSGCYVLFVGFSPLVGLLFFFVSFSFVSCCCFRFGVVDLDLVSWCVFGVNLVLFVLDLAFLFCELQIYC